MHIKQINASAMKTATPEKRLSSSHERIEINVSQQDDKDDILSTVSERIFSPGQLELQRKVALAQSSRKTEDIQPKNTSDTVREVRMAKSSYSHNKAAPIRRSRQMQRSREHHSRSTSAVRFRRTLGGPSQSGCQSRRRAGAPGGHAMAKGSRAGVKGGKRRRFVGVGL